MPDLFPSPIVVCLLLVMSYTPYSVLGYAALWFWHERKTVDDLHELFGQQVPRSSGVIFGYRVRPWSFFAPRLVALHLDQQTSVVHYVRGRPLNGPGLVTRQWLIRPMTNISGPGSPRRIRCVQPRGRPGRRWVFSIHPASESTLPEWVEGAQAMSYYDGKFGYELRRPAHLKRIASIPWDESEQGRLASRDAQPSPKLSEDPQHKQASARSVLVPRISKVLSLLLLPGTFLFGRLTSGALAIRTVGVVILLTWIYRTLKQVRNRQSA